MDYVLVAVWIYSYQMQRTFSCANALSHNSSSYSSSKKETGEREREYSEAGLSSDSGMKEAMWKASLFCKEGSIHDSKGQMKGSHAKPWLFFRIQKPYLPQNGVLP